MTDVLEFLEWFNDGIWLIPFFMILGIGLYSFVRLKGLQITQIPEMIRVTFMNKKQAGEYSSFRIFCVSMGNRIGVGNITGPILAILVGGPGAIFWMWVFAIIGASTSFIETTLGQIFKKKNPEGEYEGGPAYNILHGLKMPRFACLVALIVVAMHFVGYMSMEACSITDSLGEVINFEYNKVFIGILLVVIMIVMMVGGFKRISNISSVLIPLMAFGWLLICTIAIFTGKGGLLNALGMVFDCAFNVPALVGGGIGTVLVVALRRAILSTEAGLGTATYISSKADVDHPAQQGLSQAFGSMSDIIICSFTAFAILSAFGSYEEIRACKMQSFELLNYVFEPTLGSLAPIITAVFIFVFAFSSMMGDYVIGKSNIYFVTDSKKVLLISTCVMLSVLFICSVFASDRMFVIVDIFLAITSIFNCVILILLGKHAFRAYDDYMEQKRNGIEDPVFDASVLDNKSGVTEWDRKRSHG